MAAEKKTISKVRTGVVVGNKMKKTVVVEVSAKVLHPQFKKYIERKKKFKAHDEKEICRPGDRVEIVESRPLSKTKNWRVRKVLQSTVAE